MDFDIIFGVFSFVGFPRGISRRLGGLLERSHVVLGRLETDLEGFISCEEIFVENFHGVVGRV